MRRHATLTVVLLAAAALVLGACGLGGPADPGDALVDAAKRTFSGPFAYDLTFELDDAARGALAKEDAQAAAFLPTLRVSGRWHEPGTSFAVAALGLDVFEMRVPDEGQMYVRIDPGAIAAFSGGELRAEDLAAEFGNMPPGLGDVVDAALAGRWIGLEVSPDEFEDLGAVPVPQLDPAEMMEVFERHFGDPDTFVGDHLVVSEVSSGDERVLDVRVRARAAAESFVGFLAEIMTGIPGFEDVDDLRSDLGDVPETLAGITVRVADRTIRRIEVDAFELARSAGARDVPDGTLRIVLTLSQHGTAEAVVAPDGALVLTGDDLRGMFGDFFFSDMPDDALLMDAEGGDIHAEARNLAFAQEVYFADNASYADRLDDLEDFTVLWPGLLHGTCAYDGGDAYVVAASDGSGTVFLDSRLGLVVAEDDLGCVPVLVPAG